MYTFLLFRECRNLQKVDCSGNDMQSANGLSKSVLNVSFDICNEIICILCINYSV